MIPIVNRRRFLGSAVAGILAFTTGCVSDSGAGGESELTTAEETTFNQGEDSEAETTITAESTDEGPSTAETTVQDTLEPSSVEKENWSDENTPQMSPTLGSQSQLEEQQNPHWIHIWNDAPNSRSIRIQISPVSNSERTTFRETYRINPRSYITLGLMRPGDYVIRAGVGDGELKKVGRALVDCNTSETRVRVRKEGSIESSTLSNTKECWRDEVNLTTT